jgi:hypothetical protein
MTDDKKSNEADESDISAPRLTPQGRTDPEEKGADATGPQGGAKKGQSNPAEG